MQEEVAVHALYAAHVGHVADGAAGFAEYLLAPNGLVALEARSRERLDWPGQRVHKGHQVFELLAIQVRFDLGIVWLPDWPSLVGLRRAQANLVGASGGDELLECRELGLPAEFADPAIREDARPAAG